jgi:hypothetical protein
MAGLAWSRFEVVVFDPDEASDWEHNDVVAKVATYLRDPV